MRGSPSSLKGFSWCVNRVEVLVFGGKPVEITLKHRVVFGGNTVEFTETPGQSMTASLT